MEIKEQTTYSITDLTKEELLFFFEVVEKMELSSDSTPISFELAERFKKFREQLLESEQETTTWVEPPEGVQPDPLFHGECEGCGTTIEVKKQNCPATNVEAPLCPVCFLNREHLAEELLHKQHKR